MSNLRQEIIESQKFRGEMIKWKLVACAALGAIGLGLSVSGGTSISFSIFGGSNPSIAILVLSLIPLACVYCDAACLHTNLRISVIGGYAASHAKHDDHHYESFAKMCSETTAGRKDDVNVFDLEELILKYMTYIVCIISICYGSSLIINIDSSPMALFTTFNGFVDAKTAGWIFILSGAGSFVADNSIRGSYSQRENKIRAVVRRVENYRTIKINNDDIRDFVKQVYSISDLNALNHFLDDTNVLNISPLPTGLFAAAGLKDEVAKETGYGNVWVRDNVFVAHALLLAGQTMRADAAVAALARYFSKYSKRFADIVDGAADPDDVRNRPNVRFDGVNLAELDQKWAQAQNDALGYFLWIYGKRIAAKTIAADEALLDLFVRYFERIEYWKDADSGHWEEARKVQASSIGPVVAGLMQLRDLLRHNLIRAGEGASALTQDRLASLIEKGQHGLRGILPSESLEPAARARRYDASLLFLIYPLAVVDQTMADRICQDVEIHLQGAFGIRRYRGDSYWTQDYKDKIPAGERTADFSDRQEERDALAVPGKEAQWCIFDPILSAIWGQRYERTRSQDDLDRQTFYFNRSLGQITGSSCPQGALKCPEAYYVEHGRYVPNDHAPLLWTQANLLTALLWMKKSASPPVNR